MKYLCLIYDEEAVMRAMPKAESDAFMGEYMTFTEDVRKKGHYVAGEALHPVSSATTVRVRNGSIVTTDGPFAETTEQLGGFYLIEARDLILPPGASEASGTGQFHHITRSNLPKAERDQRPATMAVYSCAARSVPAAPCPP